MSAFHPFLAPVAVALVLSQSAPADAQDPVADVRALIGGASFQRASASLGSDHDRWVREIVTLTEIPAPPFGEQARAEAFAGLMRDIGLAEVGIDAAGNVLGLRRGDGDGDDLIVVSAHLDTVFPAGVDLTVRREGDRLYAPGVGDDSTGLASLLSLARAMNAADIRTGSDILFVGTVGEEGLGDLRGVRYLFEQGPYRGRIDAFISIDGAQSGRLVDVGVGSKRYRITFRGPGGHSYGAFGIVNPAAALGRAITDFYETPVPETPKATYSVSVVGGGVSVNSIPGETWMEVDMRSADPGELAKLETRLLAVASEAATAENDARSTRDGRITVEAKPIGDRPAGSTPHTSSLVRYAEAAHAAFDQPVTFSASSTDSNVPMSLAIPALTLPRAFDGGRTHSTDEWVDVSEAPNTRLRTILLATVLAVAGAR
ncbi:MAG: M20/M25/M40 family metallo-hydrolase [Brevundimonas sp.]|uniref:M20/M25/M40 family metallo-hydrolase n=1 Tax=Brevundimonas sp. TaxID=1871086 RepID=UPI0027172A48|nr:M20/M25/M40 family metallo-hydrolase [Brevundimonas sp.]MDO9077643.1 M20/M25/M40 family metallo-hydrolase [Brevundimonas sp.]MDP3079504.1 M20/M25/M40 family metallo-hydrolase [Brevundimonas sp.]MDZ4060710.1 M20/M25/M40 family metallo-hydrolase [Brevundimonas sp.]